MDISVVISLYNEEESLRELVKGIHDVLDRINVTYEIIMVNDGSKDKSWEVMQELAVKDENIRTLSLSGRWGVSATRL